MHPKVTSEKGDLEILRERLSAQFIGDLADPNPSCSCCSSSCLDCMNIETRIISKLQNTVYVEYTTRIRNGETQFRFRNAWLLTSFSLDSFRANLDTLVMEFRLYGGRDRGTACRINSSNIENLFETTQQLIENHEIVPQQELA